MKVTDTLEILKALNKASSNKDYKDVESIGLKREGIHKELGIRLMDGFNTSMSGNHLTISYHTNLSTKESHNRKLNKEIEEMIFTIAKHIKRRYKEETGDALKIKETAPGLDVFRVESLSQVRIWAIASKSYTIGNLEILK